MIELLLVMGITAIIFAFSAPYTLNFYRTQITDDARSNIIEALQRARHYAVLQKNDSNFGVKINNSDHQYVLFQGGSYATKVDLYDEVYDLIDNIEVSGEDEIVFSKLTGVPSATGTISLSYGTVLKEILIQDSGTVSKVQ